MFNIRTKFYVESFWDIGGYHQPKGAVFFMVAIKSFFDQESLGQLGAPEPSFYLDNSQWGFFTIIAMNPRRSRWEQGERISFSYPLNELHERLAEWTERGRIENKSIFVSQCAFNRPCRRRSAFKSVGQLFVDLDFYHAPSMHVRCMSKGQIVNHIYMLCEANDLPSPSIIMSSGRGLYLKWFTNEVPSQGLAMWEHAQEYLNKIFEPLGADSNAKDVSRILRLENTFNHKNSQVAEVIEINWDAGEPARYSFGELCNTILPYTLDAVKEFNARREETNQEFARNRRIIKREVRQRNLVHECLRELARGGHDKGLTAKKLHSYVADTRGKGKVSLPRCAELLGRWERGKKNNSLGGNISDARSIFAQKNLAWTRYSDILRIAEHRYNGGHIEDGLRSPFFLYACNFYALSEWRSLRLDFYHEFNSIGNGLVPLWSQAKKSQASSDVYKRLKEVKSGRVRVYGDKEFTPLLTPRNGTLIDLLKITEDEMKLQNEDGSFLIKTIISREEKMRRKPIHSERRRREKGIVSRDKYEKERKDNADLQSEEAKRLKLNGLNGKEIAKAMGISTAWVSKLLNR